MKNEIEAMITDITTTTAEAEDYTGEDGLFCRQPSVCESAAYSSGTVFRPTDGRKTDPHKGGKPTN